MRRRILRLATISSVVMIITGSGAGCSSVDDDDVVGSSSEPVTAATPNAADGVGPTTKFAASAATERSYGITTWSLKIDESMLSYANERVGVTVLGLAADGAQKAKLTYALYDVNRARSAFTKTSLAVKLGRSSGNVTGTVVDGGAVSISTPLAENLRGLLTAFARDYDRRHPSTQKLSLACSAAIATSLAGFVAAAAAPPLFIVAGPLTAVIGGYLILTQCFPDHPPGHECEHDHECASGECDYSGYGGARLCVAGSQVPPHVATGQSWVARNRAEASQICAYGSRGDAFCDDLRFDSCANQCRRLNAAYGWACVVGDTPPAPSSACRGANAANWSCYCTAD